MPPQGMPPPVLPPAEAITNWEHWAADPASIPTEDRNWFLRLHPYGEADALCRERTGLGIAELYEKGVRTDDLSEKESHLIGAGPGAVFNSSLYRCVSDFKRWPVEMQEKYNAVHQLVETDGHRQAKRNSDIAGARHYRLELQRKYPASFRPIPPMSDLLPPPPVLPTAETLAKWECWAAEPESIPTEDKHRFLGIYPYEESNAFCKAKTGLEFAKLVEKCATTDDLTLAEAGLIKSGPGYALNKALYRDPWDIIRWPAEIRDKYNAVRDAVKTDIYEAAQKNAWKADDRYHKREAERLDQISWEDRRNIQWANRSNWVADLDGQPENLPWGFVCLRTSFQDDVAWTQFQEQLLEATDLALHFVRNRNDTYWTHDQLRRRVKVQWVEDRALEDSPLADLASYFRTFRDEGKVLPGLRQDVFLVGNSKALECCRQHHPLPARGYVLAVDASHEPEKLAKYLYGFKGSVRVALTAAFTTFYARLIPRGDPDDDPTVEKEMRQSFEVVYLKSKFDRPWRIYPPLPNLNRP